MFWRSITSLSSSLSSSSLSLIISYTLAQRTNSWWTPLSSKFSSFQSYPNRYALTLSSSFSSANNQIRFCSSHNVDEQQSLDQCNEHDVDDDLPAPTMENPFLKEKPQCVLCRYGVVVDYKNVRLLSQFVSPYTGKLYDKHITGLCEQQHRAVRTEISRAVKFGLMSPFYRDPKFANDPKLFDPTRPTRPNPY